MDPMELMFQEAERTGKWFYCSYQDLWFSAKDLRKRRENGCFRWGVENWELRDPQERLAQLKIALEAMKKAVEAFEAKISEA